MLDSMKAGDFMPQVDRFSPTNEQGVIVLTRGQIRNQLELSHFPPFPVLQWRGGDADCHGCGRMTSPPARRSLTSSWTARPCCVRDQLSHWSQAGIQVGSACWQLSV